MRFVSWWHFLGLPDGVVPAQKSIGISCHQATLLISQVSLVAQMVKNLSTMQETQFQSLGQEDPQTRE